jgi:hypothetical protein
MYRENFRKNKKSIHRDFLGQWAKIILLFQTFIKIKGKNKNWRKKYIK